VSWRARIGETKTMAEKISKTGRVPRRFAFFATLLGFAAALLAASPPQVLAGPLYDIHAHWADTNLPPGGEGLFIVEARNLGDAAGGEDLSIVDQLPAGVTVKALRFRPVEGVELAGTNCSGVGTETAECFLEAAELPTYAKPQGAVTGGNSFSPEPAGFLPVMYIDVKIDPLLEGMGTNTATLSGGGAPTPVTQVRQVHFAQAPSEFGIVPGSYAADVFDAAYPFGSPLRRAGDRPFELRVGFEFNRKVGIQDGVTVNRPHGKIKTVEATLPRGMVANPEATPKCTPTLFAEVGSTPSSSACPPDTQVGYLNIDTGGAGQLTQAGEAILNRVPIYSLEPPQGVPADFAFKAAGLVQGHIYGIPDPAQEYAIKSVTPNISNLIDVMGSEVTIWGVPGDPAHDKFRAFPDKSTGKSLGAAWGSAPIRPFLTNPMDCGVDNGGTLVRLESYSDPGNFTPVEEYGSPLNVEGCDDPRFRFEPDISLQPTTRDAGAPTGLDVHLEVPQRNDEAKEAKDLYAPNGNVKAIPTPPIKKAVVTFPEGMTISPSAAQGLGSCSLEQVGLETDKPVTCPDSSQYGTLTIHTPILPANHQPEGFVYVAKQNDNPFHNFISLYLVIQEPDRGILIKIPGKVDLDSVTGQIKTTFDDLPQFPVSDMQMSLKGGLRAGLVNPSTCGKKTISAEFFTWQDPETPHPVNSSYDITQNPDGSPCYQSPSERPFDPQLSGGTLNNTAGSFSPLELRMTRTDEDQELSVVEGTAPPGLTASLRGVAECSDAQIAAAANPARTGTEELEAPSCPASSQVGTVDAGAGVGQVLTYVKGRVYLAGPYEGAPVSGVAIVPAVAGPFDLGTIVTRAPAYVDPQTAQLRLKTDPLPLIFKGVPVRVRDIRVHLDRPDFTLNPTNCEPMSLNGTLFSSEGKSKAASDRFQAADCGALGFKPHLSLRLKGPTGRGGHPALTAVLKARAGDANIAGAQVTLPHSEYLDQGHLNNICTRVLFAAKECPPASIYGYAKAITPLFDTPVQGPVYLRSNPAHKLPDLVAALRGPASLPVEVDLQGRVDSAVLRNPRGEKVGRIRNTFEVVPDAPVTEFTLFMQGGKKGLLENSENLCTGTFRATAKFSAQNGKAITLRPALKATSCKGKGRKAHGHRAARRH
jgi:hypothetical protein